MVLVALVDEGLPHHLFEKFVVGEILVCDLCRGKPIVDQCIFCGKMYCEKCRFKPEEAGVCCDSPLCKNCGNVKESGPSDSF